MSDTSTSTVIRASGTLADGTRGTQSQRDFHQKRSQWQSLDFFHVGKPAELVEISTPSRENTSFSARSQTFLFPASCFAAFFVFPYVHLLPDEIYEFENFVSFRLIVTFVFSSIPASFGFKKIVRSQESNLSSSDLTMVMQPRYQLSY